MNAGVLFAYQSLYSRIESGIHWTNACPCLPIYARAVCVQQEARAIARQFLPVHLLMGVSYAPPYGGLLSLYLKYLNYLNYLSYMLVTKVPQIGDQSTPNW